MCIIDAKKKHDYYDIGMGLGHDDSVVYVREPRDIVLNKWGRDDVRSMVFQDIYVGFCGKIYPAYQIWTADKDRKTPGSVKTICYDIADADKVVETYFDKVDAEHYHTAAKPYRYYSFLDPTTRRALELGFQKQKEHYYANKTSLFTEYNCPIFVIDPPRNQIHINCLLKPWEFYKVFDPYTAYQEVSMFVGGVLLSHVNPVPDIPDDTMRDIKGFDKWSFRKEPTKKK